MVTGGKGAVHGSGPILTATVSLSFAPICFVSFCFSLFVSLLVV
jgi:hypothetical protein